MAESLQANAAGEFDDVDAVVLVGGQGTRLRPLTLSAAKPMLPAAGVPFLAHQLSRLAAVGIRRVVLGTSYKAETFENYFGDGAALGLELRYVVEDTPLGTGGAIRNVLHELKAPTVMVLNGDILSGVDLAALLHTHRSGSADVTLHLVRVTDPRAFGCVPTGPDGSVLAFLEKTPHPPTDQINAGCYLFQRTVIESIPAGEVVSVERDTFPGLLASGARILGHVESSYWLDLGTPAAFVQGSADLVRGIAPSSALPGPVGEFMALPRARIADNAVVEAGSSLGEDVVVGERAQVLGSVVFDGAVIGDDTFVADSVIGAGAFVGNGTVIRDAVIGDRAVIGAGCELLAGARVWPDVHIPAGGIRFSAPA